MSKENKTPNYEKALAELQQIQDKLEDHNTSIDEIAPLMQRAAQLLEFCKQKLRDLELSLQEWKEDK